MPVGINNNNKLNGEEESSNSDEDSSSCEGANGCLWWALIRMSIQMMKMNVREGKEIVWMTFSI